MDVIQINGFVIDNVDYENRLMSYHSPIKHGDFLYTTAYIQYKVVICNGDKLEIRAEVSSAARAVFLSLVLPLRLHTGWSNLLMKVVGAVCSPK